MQALQQLAYSDLPIPVWQIILYVGLISYFMIQRWFKLSFVTSFILVLYWLHYAFRADLVSITSEAHLARAIYYLLGFALILLTIFALSFLEVDTDSLLAKREKEITFLKAQAKNAEKTASALQVQLEKDESQGSNAKKKREKKLNAKIDKLETKLQEARSLLETRDAKISDLQSQATEAQQNASALETLLEMYKTQESNTKKNLEEELNIKIDALQDQLHEGESRLARRDVELAELRARASDAESNAAALKAHLENSRAKESTTRNDLENEFRSRIDQLENQLKHGESLLAQRGAEIAELQTRASEAEANASILKAQLENNTRHESVAGHKLEEELNAKIDNLNNRVKHTEGLLESRNAEVAEFKAKALEADKKAAVLKAQIDKDQTEGSIAKRKLEEKLNAKLAKLENQLKQGESLLQKRDAEITELQSKASDAQKNTATVKAQSERDKAEASAAAKKLEDELNARIEEFQRQLREGEALLQKRNTEIAELQAKSSDAEMTVSALKNQLETDVTNESAAKRKLERELNNEIAMLTEKLKQGELLLENRNSEITALRAKVADAEKGAVALKIQLEEVQSQVSVDHKQAQEEFNARISKLEEQLKQSETLLDTRDAEVVDFKARAAEAEKHISTLKAQLENNQTQVSFATRKLEEELNGKIAKLENQLKQGETLLKTRNSEMAALQVKAAEAEKSASALKAQLGKDKTQVSSANGKLEEELNAKIAKLESELKESAGLLERRNAEIAELRAKAVEADSNASAAKSDTPLNRQWGQHQGSDDKTTMEEDVRRRLHQFQYAVKYLEDEVKEKDRLLSLMAKKGAQAQASTKTAVDEDFKKKIHQLEQAVKYLENQSKEKDGLLSLMAKRNRELADLKSKAEEKLEALEANSDGDQTGKGSQADIASER
jgi:chromosome segregation ATPase